MRRTAAMILVITFAIDAEKSTLTNIGRTSTGGKVPQLQDRSGRDVHGHVQSNSNSMQTATVDPSTGQLTAKDLIETPSATIAVFLPAADQ